MSSGWEPPKESNATARLRVSGRARTVLARGLALVRSDKDLVIWPAAGLGGGNHLYMWCYAWQASRQGRTVRLLRQPGMEGWLEEFPALRGLTIDREDVRFRQARVPEMWAQKYENRDAFDGFVREVLLSSERFIARLERARERQAGILTVNVRRGDYYTNPDFAQVYAMDLGHYFTLVREAAPQRSYQGILAVSDDPGWCEEHLGHFFADVDVEVAPSEGMFDDLAWLGAADALVLANSTFSYWGGYINEVYHDRTSSIWAPTFHWNQGPESQPAWQLSPTWRAVDNLEHELTRQRP